MGQARPPLPGDLPRLESVFRKWIESDRTEEHWEYRFFRPDGEMRWMSSRARIVRDKDGNALRNIGTTMDVTDLKRSQNLMRAQRNLAVTLASASASAFEEQLRLCCEAVIEVSEMDCGALYLEEETPCAPFRYFIWGWPGCNPASAGRGREFGPRPSPHVKRAQIRAGRYMILPGEARWKEELRTLAIVPLLREERVIGCFIVGSHALEEIPFFARAAMETIAAQTGNAIARLKAEQALRESEEKFRVLFEESKDAIIIATLEGEVAEVNRAFLELLAYTGPEASGLTLGDICFDRRQEHNLVREISRTGGVKDFGLLLKKKDGTTAECLITASARLGRNEAPVGYQGIIRDVTEKRRLEREILQISSIERQEIGQDLHDNLGQHMLGIALKAKSLALTLERQSLPEAKEAERLTDLVNQAIGQVRDASKGLVPIDFEAGGMSRHQRPGR